MSNLTELEQAVERQQEALRRLMVAKGELSWWFAGGRLGMIGFQLDDEEELKEARNAKSIK